ncbi:MAG: response regulator [Lentisphaerae bacterium]|nr:response regulator [Lentisphaerota bacterium]
MVLVVDDNDAVVITLRELLQKEGYEVKTAHDGLEAYALVKLPECRCMLLDVNMPRINGVELLLLMQAEGIDVPTIVMAGFDDFDEPEMKQFQNVVRFFHKPVEAEPLLRVVRRYAGAVSAGVGKGK